MSLNFKIDSRDRVWLLWSNSIRLASEMPPGRETFTHVGSPINIGEMVSKCWKVSAGRRPLGRIRWFDLRIF